MVLPAVGSKIIIDNNPYNVSSYGFGYWIQTEREKYPVLFWEGRWILYLFKEADINEIKVKDFYFEEMPKEEPTDKVFVVENKICQIDKLWMGYFINEEYLIIKRRLFYPSEIEANLINPLPKIGTDVLINGVNYPCEKHVEGRYISVGDDYAILTLVENNWVMYEQTNFIVAKTDQEESEETIISNQHLFKILGQIYEKERDFVGYLVDGDKLIINANVFFPRWDIQVEPYYSLNSIRIRDEAKDSKDVVATHRIPFEDYKQPIYLHHHPLEIKPKTELPKDESNRWLAPLTEVLKRNAIPAIFMQKESSYE